MGMVVSSQTGVSTSLSAPALKRWMSLTFLRSFTSLGKTPNVTRTVASKKSSVAIVSGDREGTQGNGRYHQGFCGVRRRIPL